MKWFSRPEEEKYKCQKHGIVKQALRLKDMGKFDGLYCAKCQAEFWATTLQRVEVVSQRGE